MKVKYFLFSAVLTAIFLFSNQAFAVTFFGQEMSSQEKEMMEMMMKYGSPGAHHELLKKYMGDWNVEVKSWMKPGAEPMISQATQKNELILNGRYLKGTFKGMMMGQTYEGIELIGYDQFKEKYVTVWIDNMSTGFFLSSGTLDESGKVLTETGQMPDPMTGGMQKVKNVTTFLEDGKYRFEMFMIMDDGIEFKSMELLANRKM